MKKLKISQYPIAGIWWIQRQVRYFFWSCFNRLSIPPKFKYVGKGVKFNGRLRVEHPFSPIRIGDYSMIGVGCYFLATSSGSINIGNHVHINDNCYITSCYGIKIGNNTSIAEQVSIRDYDHEFVDTSIPISSQGFRGAPIEIGEDVWIGRGVMIASGVTIGRGCVIGANAVVTKDLPDWSVAVGVPARTIKNRLAANKQSV